LTDFISMKRRISVLVSTFLIHCFRISTLCSCSQAFIHGISAINDFCQRGFHHAYPDTAHNSFLILSAKVRNRMHLTGRHVTQKIGKPVAHSPQKHHDEKVFVEVLPRHSGNYSEFEPELPGCQEKARSS